MVNLSKEQFNAISQVIQYTYEQQRLRPCDMKRLESFRSYLESLCQPSVSCGIDIFGSIKNGFGTKNSDVDLCLHLNPASVSTQRVNIQFHCPDDLKFIYRQSRNVYARKMPSHAAILLGLACELQKTRNFKKLKAILAARVPVLKLSCGSIFNGLQADLTVSNEVAMFNTKLLEVYGKLDSRVPQLGVALKVWAKCCNISGASEGWLSSYAYIIMLIHFLQSTEKPVLPFLQQVSSPSKPKKPVLFGGWDVYFYKPSEMVWLSPNSQTVAELWLDFFMYYAWVFDFENEVVQIRHPKKLTKKRKGWEASPLAMEDPFVLSHNLAATVDAEALLHIKETFALTYYHFANGLFLRCGKELDISHARSLYRKFGSVGNDEAITLCAKCWGSAHESTECTYKKFLDNEKDENEISRETSEKEAEESLAFYINSNSSSDSGVSSLCSDSDHLLSSDSKSRASTGSCDEIPVTKRAQDNEELYERIKGEICLLPRNGKADENSSMPSQENKKKLPKDVAGSLNDSDVSLLDDFGNQKLVTCPHNKIDLNCSDLEQKVDINKDSPTNVTPLFLRFCSAAGRRFWYTRFLFFSFRKFFQVYFLYSNFVDR